MTKTVVIYHSGYGHTQRVAQFVAEGAKAQVIAIDADGNITEADWTALDAADAIILSAGLRARHGEAKLWKPKAMTEEIRRTEGWIFGVA